ncbi:hypothetical protein OJF2_09910 [Aquisphaera giovannonii]|uniref:DUF2946 domain-containing protein n=1 Tax=Aquisphaera giovannonii TaxID=406548 RepID=A0A5B9VWR9_9BACT|nr:hypothetical protein [Aquisphaera giovannonii]QEH32514.1 hypothetical protein OJF2_09910 [Aquisphaera giovannonii]
MPRPARPLLACCLLAIHAVATLCGPCLHDLPGWAHSPELSRAEGHQGGVAEGAATAEEAAAIPAGALHLQGDDCPICHYLGQPQLAADPPTLATGWQPSGWQPFPERPPATRTSVRSASPRAPPASTAVAA